MRGWGQGGIKKEQKKEKEFAQEMISTWLCRSNLKRETESLLIAALDNTIRTNNIKTRKKSHDTLVDWYTGREWPLNCMTVISA